MRQVLEKAFLALLLSFVYGANAVADDFTVERAVNLSQLDSWTDISQFQWQEIDHSILDNREEMDALKTLFNDPAPKDTVGFYKQIYDARDNQYIVLRLDKAQGNRPFHIRVTCKNNPDDPSQNTSKVFAAENYAYIMPPISENQIELKIWPQGEGEEKAKTYVFNIHGYGSASVRTVMLDKSRIVDGDYDLQLIRYNSETEKSDTAYIRKLQTDKLYTFYDYNDGDLKEAYLMTNNFKRIKLKHEWWAMDAVTHVSDNTVMMMTGPKMPFRQHKRLDAPNPTYLDSRLFSYHDTLWVNLFLDNVQSDSIKGLTLHAVPADTANMPKDTKLLDWGKDPVSGRLYVITDGEPCTIECYRDGFLPKLCKYPGSYNHKTGVISSETEVVDIFLESISAPVTSPKVTSAVLSTLTPTNDRRGDIYVSHVQTADILPVQKAETIYYDEFASKKDTVKYADGMRTKNYANMEVAIVSPRASQNVKRFASAAGNDTSSEPESNITLKKVKNDAEENDILKDSLEGKTVSVRSKFFDYDYFTTDFDLSEYLASNTSGRPSIAFNGDVVRELPILANRTLNLQKIEEEIKKSAEEHLSGDAAEISAKDWITGITPDGASHMDFRIPFHPPYYFRFDLDIDFFKTKKLSLTETLGVGVEGKYDMANKSAKYWPNESQTNKVSMGTTENYELGVTDLSPTLDELLDKKPKKQTSNTDITFSAFAELYTKYSVPLTLEDDKWAQWFTGTQWLDEAGLYAEANAESDVKIDIDNMISFLGNQAGIPDAAKLFAKWVESNTLTQILQALTRTSLSTYGGSRLAVNTGLFSFKNLKEPATGGIISNTLKNHLLAFKFTGQAYVHAKIKSKLDAWVAGAEFGLNSDAAVDFRHALGSRLDFRNPFSGSAYGWYAKMEAYFKIKFLFWSTRSSWDLLKHIDSELKLVAPEDYKNPYHKNFAYYLSDEEDPDATPSDAKAPRNALLALPGDLVSTYADINQPVKYISGGDSIIYQGNQGSPDDPNKFTVEVASLGNPVTLSDSHMGGCSDYDAASVPGLDMVLMEQATEVIPKEQLEDSLTLEKSVKEGSRVFDVYYTKKTPGTKWYQPKPVYSSPETASFKPRLAMADDGKAVAVWQEGLIEKGSWVTEKDTVKLNDLVMTGNLMMSRFDGNETWSEPVKLMELNETCSMKDYRVSYDGTTAFIVASKGGYGVADENISLTIDASNNVTTHPMEQSDNYMRLCRIGDNNLVAWMAIADTVSGTKCIRVKNYGMDGNAKKGINTSLILSEITADEFSIVPDMQAKSLNNVAVLWRQTTFENDTAKMCLMASRLVPDTDGSFHLGTPITAVKVDPGSTIYNFDGYMTNEKIQVCFVATDKEGNTQLNKKAAYFGNAYGYTVEFNPDNNQGYMCDKDEISLLITVNNYGTSNISECVLIIDGKNYPLDMTIPAGAYAKERVIVPCKVGDGLNTDMIVKYDDILGKAEQNTPESKSSNKTLLKDEIVVNNGPDRTYQQTTARFFPYHPQLECFVVAQKVDENGDNYITVCVRNYARRQLPNGFAIMVGLKEHPYSSIVYHTTGNDHIKYETKKLVINTTDPQHGDGYMHNYGSYHAGYVTLKVPQVTEKEMMYVGATVVYNIPKTNLYVRVMPNTFSGSNNSGVVTLYPSSEVVAVEHVYNNNDTAAKLHVRREANSIVVTGAKADEQVRLYHANGVVIARKQADKDGKVTFPVTLNKGIGLVSAGQETVKFVY